MKIVVVCNKNGFLERHIDDLDKAYPDEEIEMITLGAEDKNTPLNPILKDISPDLLITEDLIRFDEATLTDGIAYNLIDCRQIHLIMNENISNISFMLKQLSLNMHFFCKNKMLCDRMFKMNQDIPFIEEIPQNWIDTVNIVMK